MWCVLDCNKLQTGEYLCRVYWIVVCSEKEKMFCRFFISTCFILCNLVGKNKQEMINTEWALQLLVHGKDVS